MVEELEGRRLLAATVPVDSNSVANAVPEGAAVGMPVGVTASSTGSAAVTYSLSDDAGGRFTITAATGVVRVANGSLLDGPSSHVITAVASDGTGAASQSFTIAVNNVAPAARIRGNASTREGGAYTVDLSSSDPGSDTITSWTIDWGDGSAPEALGSNPSSATHVYPDGRPRQLLGTTLLNEMKVNAPGPHGPYEYVELRGDPGAALNNLYFISIEGDADPEAGEPLGAGTVEMVVGLTGHSVGASGLLVIKGTNPGHAIPADTSVVISTHLDTPGRALENGSNTFMIVSSPTPIAEGTDYDLDNDGVLELLPAGAAVLDAVGWSDGGALDKVYGGVTLRQSSGVPEAVTRFFGNTTANSAAAWFNGPLVGESDTVAYDTARTSTNFPSGGALSPGGSNVPVNVLPPPRLNELKVNPPTLTDNPYEYVELKGAPNQTLARLFLVVLESDSSGTPGGIGRADMVVNLSGVSLGSNGLLMIKGLTGGHAAPDGTAVFLDSQFDTAGGGLENGSNSFLLVSSLNAIIEGTDYDIGNSGALELPAGAVVLDAVGWSDGEAGDVVYGGVALQQAGVGVPHAATRFANNSTPSSATAWYNGALAGATADSLAYDTTQASADFPAGGVLTPGADNVPPGTPPPFVFPSVNGYQITARVADEDGSYNTSLTLIVDDVAPTLAISGLASASEGGTYSLTLGEVTDPGTDTVSSYVVHWGDGSSDTHTAAGDVTHVFADDFDAYEITVDVVNEDGTFLNCADPLSVAVDDVPPTVLITGAASVTAGGTYSLTLEPAQDPGVLDTVSTYVVNWGDGTSEAYPEAGVASHSYAEPNVYAITVDLVNEEGTFTDRANALSVTVEAGEPTGLSLGVDQAAVAVNEGQAATNSGTLSAPAGAVVTLTASIGTALLNADGTWSWSWTPADGPGESTVTITATDVLGGSTSVSFGLLVSNVAPTFTLSVKPTVDEGGVLALHVAIVDPGILDNLVLVVNWDEGEPETVQVPAGTTEFKVTHRYLDDRPTATSSDLRTIGVSLTDKDGGTAVATATTTVKNVAADVQFNVDAARNTLFRSFRGSFTDVGTLDSWTGTVNFGDGTGDQVLTLNEDKTFTFNHAYAAAGSYDVIVTVTDDDGGVRQVKRKFNVRL